MKDFELLRKLCTLWEKEMNEDDKTTSYGGAPSYLTFYDFKEGLSRENEDEAEIIYLYDYALGYFYYETLNFCGCGNPSSICDYILKFFECFGNVRDDIFMICKEVYDVKFANHTSIEFEFMAKYFDSLGFSEHGTSVYSSWLTEKGKLYYELLRRRKELEIEDF